MRKLQSLVSKCHESEILLFSRFGIDIKLIAIYYKSTELHSGRVRAQFKLTYIVLLNV